MYGSIGSTIVRLSIFVIMLALKGTKSSSMGGSSFGKGLILAHSGAEQMLSLDTCASVIGADTK